MTSYFICTLYLVLIQTPLLLTSRIRVLSNKQELEPLNSYESLEILPYITSKLADRTAVLNEENIDEQDKLLSLFTNTKREVKDAEEFLSEMLRVLKNLFTKKSPIDKRISKQSNGQNIAWSYYDDLGK